MRTFSLSKEQEKKLEQWLATIKKEVVEVQIEEYSRADHEALRDKAVFLKESYDKGVYNPYEGAIGRGLSYTFIPNNIGTSVFCEYAGHKIDLSEYDLW